MALQDSLEQLKAIDLGNLSITEYLLQKELARRKTRLRDELEELVQPFGEDEGF